MADDARDSKPEPVDEALGEMKLEESPPSTTLLTPNGTTGDAHSVKRSPSTTPGALKSGSQSPVKKQSASQTPKSEYDEHEEVIGGDITVTVEPGQAPKLLRKSSQKIATRPAPLFDHLPDATEEATQVFQVIKDCIYGSKYMGYSESDALDCDCSEDWRECITVFT